MKASKYSYSVVIPKEFIKNLKWKEKQRINIVLQGKKITLSDWKEKNKK